jgi:hypothetical protein
VAARSKACTVLARLNAVIVGLNPTQGIVCLVCVYSVSIFMVCILLCITIIRKPVFTVTICHIIHYCSGDGEKPLSYYSVSVVLCVGSDLAMG